MPARARKLSARAPIVSVIMANYNASAYLGEAIASVRRQSLRELELIVSDDASTDDSVGIVTEAMGDDPRIRLLRSEQNSGPGAARNRALALAEGDWIAVMDSDDLMHPDRLLTLVTAAERDGADIAADDLVEYEDVASAGSPAHRDLGARAVLGGDRGLHSAQHVLWLGTGTRLSQAALSKILFSRSKSAL